MRDFQENESEPLTFFVEGVMDMLPSTFENRLAGYKQRAHSSESYRYTTTREQRERRMKRESDENHGNNNS